MMARASAGEVSGPKFIVPRQRRLTVRPERPRWVNSIGPGYHVVSIAVQQIQPNPLSRAVGSPRGLMCRRQARWHVGPARTGVQFTSCAMSRTRLPSHVPGVTAAELGSAHELYPPRPRVASVTEDVTWRERR